MIPNYEEFKKKVSPTITNDYRKEVERIYKSLEREVIKNHESVEVSINRNFDVNLLCCVFSSKGYNVVNYYEGDPRKGSLLFTFDNIVSEGVL